MTVKLARLLVAIMMMMTAKFKFLFLDYVNLNKGAFLLALCLPYSVSWTDLVRYKVNAM